MSEPRIGQEEADERRRIFERGRRRWVEIVDTPASRALRAVEVELAAARRRFAPMHSPHEGIAVIHEEFRELRAHVYADTGASEAAREEAIQLAAMALRYVIDLCDEVPQ